MDAVDFFKKLGLSPSNASNAYNSIVEEVAEESTKICSIKLNENDEKLLGLEYSQYRKFVKQKLKYLSGQIDFSSPMGRRVFEVLDDNKKRMLSKFDQSCSTDQNDAWNLRKRKNMSQQQQTSTAKNIYFHKYSYTWKQRQQTVSDINLHIKAVKCMKKVKVRVRKLDVRPLCTSKISGSDNCCLKFIENDIVPMDSFTADEKKKLQMNTNVKVNNRRLLNNYVPKILLPKLETLSESRVFNECDNMTNKHIVDYISRSSENETKDLI